MEVYTAAALSFILGVMGYIIIRFWLLPILRYRRIKGRIAMDLNALLNAAPAGGGGARPQDAMRQRMKAHRIASAELSVSYTDNLPYWYKLSLESRGESPIDASKHLLVLANTRNPEHAKKRVEMIKECLRIR
jgi:hypothetical protein